MKPRIISGLIGISLLIIVLILPPIALTFASSIICAMAMIEMLTKTHSTINKSIAVVSIIYSATTPFFSLFNSFLHVFIVTFLYIFILVCLQIYYHQTQIEQTSFAFFMSLIFPISFSCLAFLRTFNDYGLFYVLLAIIIPWTSDMGAYFIGTFFGKHKLCPTISPKKTVEGLVGGILVSVISAVVTGIIYQNFIIKDNGTAVIWQIALIALISAPLSVLGDLFASLIKRQYHVKDFGNIMPGHGGVMDRFDSLLLVAPLLYIIVNYFPLVV
jgi:phosphatidate cytidylyltransferase